MIYIQIVSVMLIWLLIIPMCLGALLSGLIEKKMITLGTMYYSGVIFMLSVFQVIAVPMIIKKKAFGDLAILFNIVIVILAVLGALLFIVNLVRKGLAEYLILPKIKGNRQNVVTWLVFALFFVLQLVMSVCYMTPDGDDAYYLTEAVIAVKKGMMYTENPYTGAITALDYRHVLAPFSMYIAFLSEHFGIHATVVAHTVLPLMLIPLTYLIFYKIACVLFRDDTSKVSVFMVAIAGLQMFGASSFYTNERFFLTRTWQGKSVVANVIIPLAIYFLLLIAHKTALKSEKTNAVWQVNYSLPGIYVMLFFNNLAGALASSLGLLLLVLLEGALLFVISIRNKKLWILPAGFVSMIPCIFFMLMYVIL